MYLKGATRHTLSRHFPFLSLSTPSLLFWRFFFFLLFFFFLQSKRKRSQKTNRKILDPYYVRNKLKTRSTKDVINGWNGGRERIKEAGSEIGSRSAAEGRKAGDGERKEGDRWNGSDKEGQNETGRQRRNSNKGTDQITPSLRTSKCPFISARNADIKNQTEIARHHLLPLPA